MDASRGCAAAMRERIAVIREQLRAAGGDGIAFAAALGGGGGLAEFFEQGQSWVDHAGAGRVGAAGEVFHFLDDFVAVAGLFFDQMQNQ
jgi:hypothetical protein